MKHLKKNEKEELKRKAFQLYKDGFGSFQEIATELGIGKTTVYNWITYDYPKYDIKTVAGISSDNANIDYELGVLNELKKDIEEEYGSNKEIAVLADLRKQQMAYELDGDKLEIERQKNVHLQNMEEKTLNNERLKEKLKKTETKLEKELQKNQQLSQVNTELDSTNETLLQENNDLHELVEEISTDDVRIDLDENLKDEVTAIIIKFIEFGEETITSDDVHDLLDDTEKIIKKLKKWCKKQSVSKNDYPEIEDMTGINESLIDMLDEFGTQDEDELIFEFTTDFDIELREKYLDLVHSQDDEIIDYEDLVEEYTARVMEFLDLEDKESSIDDINDILENTEITSKRISNWYSSQNLYKSDSEELSTLNTIIETLNDLLLDFEATDKEELPITFDSEFEEKLKEKHIDLVTPPENNTPK